eukprot:TRINITY_DN8957_c0_g1_i1.p1 TRINITY_DN8957_c0_g1~~TRINITY_DN8957_c0_g1_i1.p1  ORF type:complete len:684 (+),score=229.38 TRINITY_DN8957_c0_g1_i1:363-2414(+)
MALRGGAKALSRLTGSSPALAVDRSVFQNSRWSSINSSNESHLSGAGQRAFASGSEDASLDRGFDIKRRGSKGHDPRTVPHARVWDAQRRGQLTPPRDLQRWDPRDRSAPRGRDNRKGKKSDKQTALTPAAHRLVESVMPREPAAQTLATQLADQKEGLMSEQDYDRIFEGITGSTPSTQKLKDDFFLRLTADQNEFFRANPISAVTCTTFLRGLAEKGMYGEARAFLSDMRQKYNLRPDVANYTSAVSAAAKARNSAVAQQLVDEVKALKMVPDHDMYNSLMNAFFREGKEAEAFDVIRQVQAAGLVPSVPMYSTLISGCVSLDKYDVAWSIFNRLRELNVIGPEEVLWSIMIHASAKAGNVEKALMLLEDMNEHNLNPTEVTYSSLIYACAKRPDYYDEALRFAERTRAAGFELDTIHLNTLILAAAKVGDLRSAEVFWQQLLDTGLEMDAYSWNNMYQAYANSGSMEKNVYVQARYVTKAEEHFQRLIQSGTKVSVELLTMKVKLLVHARQHEEAERVFKEDFAKFGLKRDAVSYLPMLRMWHWRGDVEKVFALWDDMQKVDNITPTPEAWSNLLYICTRNKYIKSAHEVINDMCDAGHLPKLKQIVQLLELCRDFPHVREQIRAKLSSAFPDWERREMLSEARETHMAHPDTTRQNLALIHKLRKTKAKDGRDLNYYSV